MHLKPGAKGQGIGSECQGNAMRAIQAQKLGIKGQGMALDLMIAVTIFMLLLAVSLAIWSNTATAAERQSSETEMRQLAETTLDRLIRSTGSPENWETLEGLGRGGYFYKCVDAENINSFGLAKRERVLDFHKLRAFCLCYTESRGEHHQKLLIGNYSYYFRIVDPCPERPGGQTLGLPIPFDSSYYYMETTGNPDGILSERLVRVKVSRAVTITHQCNLDEEEKEYAAIAEFTLYKEI